MPTVAQQHADSLVARIQADSSRRVIEGQRQDRMQTAPAQHQRPAPPAHKGLKAEIAAVLRAQGGEQVTVSRKLLRRIERELR